jgi:hypothetical protein
MFFSGLKQWRVSVLVGVYLCIETSKDVCAAFSQKTATRFPKTRFISKYQFESRLNVCKNVDVMALNAYEFSDLLGQLNFDAGIIQHVSQCRVTAAEMLDMTPNELLWVINLSATDTWIFSLCAFESISRNPIPPKANITPCKFATDSAALEIPLKHLLFHCSGNPPASSARCPRSHSPNTRRRPPAARRLPHERGDIRP